MKMLNYLSKIKTTLLFCALALGVTASVLASAGHIDLNPRTAVILIKDYGPNCLPELRYAVLVGSDRKHKHVVRDHRGGKIGEIPSICFFGGGIKRGETSAKAAARELNEETGGYMTVHPRDLGPEIQSKDPRTGAPYSFFVYRDDKASVKAMFQSMDAAFKNPRLTHDFKEMDDAYAIPLTDLVNAMAQIAMFGMPKPHEFSDTAQLFSFRSRGDGHGKGREQCHMNQYYLRALANSIEFETLLAGMGIQV